MQVLSTDLYYQERNKGLQEKIKRLDQKPSLSTIRIGNDSGSSSYEKGLRSQADSLGLKLNSYSFPDSISLEDIESLLATENANQATDGILIFKPLPPQWDENDLLNQIDPMKDVDGCTALNFSSLLNTDDEKHLPATAQAIFEYLKTITELAGKSILIINRSKTIGIPLFHLLLNADATVTVAHSKTKDLNAILADYDIIISAMGRAKALKADHLKKGAILLDIGISLDEEGKLSGDIDTTYLTEKEVFYLPPLAGIGKITRTILYENTYLSYKRRK